MLYRLMIAAAAACVALAPKPAAAGPALVFEPASGTVVYAEDPDRLWHPASLTKLMTAYLTFEALRDGKFELKSKIAASANANKQAPSKLGLPVDAEITVDLALRVLIVKSANDVAVMLAEAVAGSEQAFIDKMNETSRRLGMTRTKYFNPNGLPHALQVTTARDQALLARALLKDFPEYDYLYALQAVKVGKRRLRSHNKLLKNYAGADGMKTGFVCASGYNVVVSATRGGRQLVAVVLGGHTGSARNTRAASLLDHGFERLDWKSVFGDTLDTLIVNAALSDDPFNMRPYACNRRRVRRKKRRRKRATVRRPSTQKKAPARTRSSTGRRSDLFTIPALRAPA